MGTDLFTSSRGPGVIGTFIALIVLGGFGILYVFVFDESLQGGGRTIESVIKDNDQSITLLASQIGDSKKRLEDSKGFRRISGEVDQLAMRSRILEARIAEQNSALGAKQSALTEVETAFKDYKRQYRESERAAAVGETMTELTTLSGKTYTGVTITKVDPLRMQVRHSGGITGIPIDDLPEDLQDRFQPDTDEQSEVKEMEAVVVKQGTLGMIQGRIGKLNADVAQRERDIAAMRADIAKLETNRTNFTDHIKAKKGELDADRLRTADGRGVSRAPIIQGEITKAESSLSGIGSRIQGLLSKIEDYEQEIEELTEAITEARQKLEESTPGDADGDKDES